MNKEDVAGLKIDPISKQELLTLIRERIKADKKTWVTTVYSEFLYAGFKDPKVFEMLNKADFAVADGIGIFWAKRFLEIPLRPKNYWPMVLQAYWQIKYSLAAIVFYPRWIKSALPEKIVGADLIWDLAKLAADNNLSIFLLGGYNDTAEITAKNLAANKTRGHENRKFLKINFSSKNPNDPSVIEDINRADPDMLFVAYGPVRQEKWIVDSLEKLNIKLAIGVGGSFDYIAGKKSSPPKFIRYSGLEWLWRLITQPYRIKRIINATFGLMLGLLRYKIFMSFPYRPNVVGIILNNQNQVLVCQRNPNNPKDKNYGLTKNDTLNYWQFPQGGIDKNETIEQTAYRECAEETGLTNLKIFKISNKKVRYLYPNANRPLLFNQAKYKGQEQSIVYLKTNEPESAVKIDGKEFVNYKWVPINKLTQTVHEHRLEIAKIVQNDLKDLA